MSDSTASGSVTLRMLFVDDGHFHHEDLEIPREAVDRYDRLIDLLQEEPAVLKRAFVDLDRLCSAQVLET